MHTLPILLLHVFKIPLVRPTKKYKRCAIKHDLQNSMKFNSVQGVLITVWFILF